jgi:hypothetical protein
MSTLRHALQELRDAVDDLTSLQVQTFSGTIELDPEANLSFTDIRTAVKEAQSSDESTIHVVATSYLQFDGDSFNFVAADATAPMLRAHQDAVASGLAARQALLDMFRDVIGLQ